MKVILLQNVPRLGQKGDIKDVSEGYAMNMLIPRKLVKFATDSDIKQVKNQKDSKNKKSDLLQNKAHGLINAVNGKNITIKQKANEKGHLFAQIHIKEIADAIGELGFNISEDWINLEKPIKEVGEFTIEIAAYGKTGKVLLTVANLK